MEFSWLGKDVAESKDGDVETNHDGNLVVQYDAWWLLLIELVQEQALMAAKGRLSIILSSQDSTLNIDNQIF